MSVTAVKGSDVTRVAFDCKAVNGSAVTRIALDCKAAKGSAVTRIEYERQVIKITSVAFGDAGGIGVILSRIDSTDGAGIYGVLIGDVNGINKDFIVAEGVYTPGTLKVWLHGQLLSGNYWSELNPSLGVFRITNPPAETLDIMAEYVK